MWVNANAAPVALMLPRFHMPELLAGKEWPSPPLMCVTVLNPSAAEVLIREHGPFASAQIRFNATNFCLMLAKIAHSFAMANCVANIPGLSFLLPELIRNGAARAPQHLVGGLHDLEDETDFLHELNLERFVRLDRQFITARIRLFAGWRAPTYYVVVAEEPGAALLKP